MATAVEKWVEKQAELLQPRNIYWCDGSEGEARRIIEIGARKKK
jgi:GTP-dependent phosphoenolpyruvate carboxykinase